MAKKHAKKHAKKKAESGEQRAESQKTACLRCRSTSRAAYVRPLREMEHNGQAIAWYRTTCLKCGQWRIDRITT